LPNSGGPQPNWRQKCAAAIQASIDSLTRFPEIGRLVDAAGHRRLPVLRSPYVVYYRIAGDELIILHIRHTSRRPVGPAAEL
jgi:toxin ParE1/3/4